MSEAVVFAYRKDNRPLEQFIYSTYTIVLPIIVTALMGYVVWLLKNQKKDRDANSKGTMLLLRVQLIEYHDKYMRLGDIPSYAYENFMEMYDAYHALGGNGMITKMMHEIEELHLKKERGINMKNINWVVRIKNKAFWVALIPAVLLLIQVVAAVFGYTLDLGDLGNKLLDVVNAVFAVLVILGVVTDPTTKGITDSDQALTYTEPKK